MIKKPVKLKVNQKASKKTSTIPEIITKEMSIGEILAKTPEAFQVMSSYGLHCIGCTMRMYESLEMGAKTHGLSDEKIDQMLAEINRLMKH